MLLVIVGSFSVMSCRACLEKEVSLKMGFPIHSEASFLIKGHGGTIVTEVKANRVGQSNPNQLWKGRGEKADECSKVKKGENTLRIVRF